MERGPNFEFENEPMFESGDNREKESDFNQRREIIIVEPKAESEHPLSRPEDKIEGSEEIRGRIQDEKEKTSEKGATGPVFFAYPSGLVLEFNPIYDGQPSLETFTGLYKGNLVIPRQYDSERKRSVQVDEVEQKLATPLKKLPLQPRIVEPTLSESAKRKLSYQQNVQMLLSDRFSVGYDNLFEQWIVSVDKKALSDSERNVFAVFHELGHVPYLSFEDELIRAAIEKPKQIAGKSFDNLYNEIAKSSSDYISSIRTDLEELDPKLLSQIQLEIKEEAKYKLGERYQSNKAFGILRRHEMQAETKDTVANKKPLSSARTKLSIFAERIADARAALLVRQIRKKENGGVNLDFPSLSSMKSYYHGALESYAKTLNEPRFHTGVSSKNRYRK